MPGLYVEDCLSGVSIVAFAMVAFTTNKCLGSNETLKVVTFDTP